MISQFLQQGVQSVDIIPIGFQSTDKTGQFLVVVVYPSNFVVVYPPNFVVIYRPNLPGKEHDEIFDLQHEGGVGAIGRMSSQGGNYFCSGSSPHLQML